MCNMANPVEFTHETYNYRMQWRLIEDAPARYELVISHALPGDEMVELGTVCVTGFLLNAYAANRQLREQIEQDVKQAIQSGEFGND